jgi:hypothetical protein
MNIMRKNFFVLKIVAVLMKCKAQPHSTNHTKDFCEKNTPKSPYFKGICFRKSPYIDNGFQQVAIELYKINFYTFLSNM